MGRAYNTRGEDGGRRGQRNLAKPENETGRQVGKESPTVTGMVGRECAGRARPKSRRTTSGTRVRRSDEVGRARDMRPIISAPADAGEATASEESRWGGHWRGDSVDAQVATLKHVGGLKSEGGRMRGGQ